METCWCQTVLVLRSIKQSCHLHPGPRKLNPELPNEAEGRNLMTTSSLEVTPDFGALFVLCRFGTSVVTVMTMHGRADFRFAPSQWETLLQSNAVSDWLGANLKSALSGPRVFIINVLSSMAGFNNVYVSYNDDGDDTLQNCRKVRDYRHVAQIPISVAWWWCIEFESNPLH